MDRFHVVAKLHRAVHEVRAKEARELAKGGNKQLHKHACWCVLKTPENLTETQQVKLNDILRFELRTVRAWLLKDAFNLFWIYTSPHWAGWFLDTWCARAMRSRLDPIKKFAKPCAPTARFCLIGSSPARRSQTVWLNPSMPMPNSR